jgi:predicted KAP-like P-loop ATPase
MLDNLNQLREFGLDLWSWLRRNRGQPQASAGAPTGNIVDDVPIKTASQDLLRRVTFARRLADVLATSNGSEGRVLAIRGGWGYGKSSLKNLIIEQLAARTPRPQWLEFNPWQWGDGDTITRALFTEMASKLGGAHSRQAASRARALRKYAALLTSSAGALRQAAEAKDMVTWLIVAGVVTVYLGWKVPDLPLATIVAILLAVAAIIKVLGAVISHLGRDRSTEPLDSVRKDLEERLGKLDQPLIVFIDDIDRLEPDQIRLLFRQIKVNANLPKIVFVLLFQPSIVLDALKPIAGGETRDFLEKIVQASFDLPMVPRTRLIQIFAEALTKLVGALATPENGFEEVRWGNVLVGGMQPLIRNLRDVRRLLTSISIHLPLHQGANAFEVNIIDLLALEALRVFEPELHAAISERRDLFLQSGGHGLSREDRDREAIEALMQLANEQRRVACQSLIEELFPTVKWAFGGSHYGEEWLRQWTDAKRVCSARLFDRYSELQLPEGALSESDFIDFIRSSGNAADLADIISGFEAQGLLPALALRLDESVGQLPLEDLPTLLPAIFDIGKKLNDANAAPANVSFMSAWRAAVWFLRREQKPTRRIQAFIDALRRSDALRVPAVLISLDMNAREKKEPTKEMLFDDEGLQAAKALWVEKIEALARNGDALLHSHGLVSYLFRWRDFSGDVNRPRNWVRATAANDDHFPELVVRLASIVSSHSIDDYVSRTTQEYRPENFEPFFDLDELANRLAAFDRGKLTPEQAGALTLLEANLASWKSSSSSNEKSAPGAGDPPEISPFAGSGSGHP